MTRGRSDEGVCRPKSSGPVGLPTAAGSNFRADTLNFSEILGSGRAAPRSRDHPLRGRGVQISGAGWGPHRSGHIQTFFSRAGDFRPLFSWKAAESPSLSVFGRFSVFARCLR